MKMAEAAARAAARTTLTIGGVEVPVGLFPTVAKPAALAEFETAGPNGGRLVYKQLGAPAAVEPERRGDPLGDNVVGTLGPAQRQASPGEFRQVLVEDGSGEVVERDQVRRGVRLGIDRDGAFVDCSAQLDEIEARTKLDRMEVVSFIDVGQVPRERVLSAYYVGATLENGKRTLRLLHDAMRASRRAAVAKWTTRSRQACGVVVPYGTAREACLVALKLAWAEDFREAPGEAELHDVATPDPRMLDTAWGLIRAWSDTRHTLDELRDDAIVLREELLRRALAGEIDAGEPLAPAPEMPDLAAALERTLAMARE